MRPLSANKHTKSCYDHEHKISRTTHTNLLSRALLDINLESAVQDQVHELVESLLTCSQK